MHEAKEAFVAVDYEFSFVYINPIAEKFYGKSNSEIAGKKVKDIFPELWDFGPFKNGRQSVENRQPFTMRYNSPFAKGWVEMKGEPFESIYTYSYKLIDHKSSLTDELRKAIKRFR